MVHIENKLEWCLRKAKKEGEKHRGLKEVKPDMEKSNKHIAKADHNLKAMLYLIKGDFADWAISASFYARYHCLLALLAKFGYESRNQECTFAVVEHLIKEKKIDIDVKLLSKIASFEDGLEKEDLVKLREEFQYDVGTVYEHEKIKSLINDTAEFIRIVKEEMKK